MLGGTVGRIRWQDVLFNCDGCLLIRVIGSFCHIYTRINLQIAPTDRAIDV